MIFAQLKDVQTVPTGVKKAIEFVADHDLASMEAGQHVIDGENLFVNIVEYETTAPDARFWEAHKAYLDVHVPIAGTEQIDLNFLDNMAVEPYQPETDFVPANGDKNTSVVMTPGTFLVCFPQDVHRTAVAFENKPAKVRKAIFKVKI